MSTRLLSADVLELRTLAAADLAGAEPVADTSEQVTAGPIEPQPAAVDPTDPVAVDPAAVDAVLTADAAALLIAPPTSGLPTDQPAPAGSAQTNVNATTELFGSLNRTTLTATLDAGVNLQSTRDVVDEIINVDDSRALLPQLRPRR